MNIDEQYVRLLGQTVEVIVDRPLGSAHPRNSSLVYAINYGYIPGTKAEDGHEIDVYILDEARPVARYVGVIIAIIHRDDDDECKLVASRRDASVAEIQAATHFVEQYYQSTIVKDAEQARGAP